jgi:hypothetical protein
VIVAFVLGEQHSVLAAEAMDLERALEDLASQRPRPRAIGAAKAPRRITPSERAFRSRRKTCSERIRGDYARARECLAGSNLIRARSRTRTTPRWSALSD